MSVSTAAAARRITAGTSSRWAAPPLRKVAMTRPAAPSAARSAIAGRRPLGVRRRRPGQLGRFSGSNTAPVGGNPLGGAQDRTRIDAFGLITGQVGYAWNNVLAYVKGGAAVVSDKYDIFATPGGPLFASGNETRWGGTVGAGLEIGFAPNWSVGFEYDHIFLDDRNVTLTPVGGGVGTPLHIRQDVDIGTVRVNYRFGGPVVAKY